VFNILASPEKVKGMPCNIKIMDFLHHGLNLLDTGITEFKNSSALFADDVVVLLVGVGAFVVILVLAELVPLNKVAFNEKIKGIINRSSGNPGTGIFHIEEDIIGVKMPVCTVNLFEYHEALRGLPLVMLLKLRAEDSFYQFNCFFFCRMCHGCSIKFFFQYNESKEPIKRDQSACAEISNHNVIFDLPEIN